MGGYRMYVMDNEGNTEMALSKERFSDIAKHGEYLFGMNTIYEKKTYMIENMIELESACLGHSLNKAYGAAIISSRYYVLSSKLNRLMENVLASWYAFWKATKYTLARYETREYGKRLDTAFHQLFLDDPICAAGRELRDYSQHQAISILGITEAYPSGDKDAINYCAPMVTVPGSAKKLKNQEKKLQRALAKADERYPNIDALEIVRHLVKSTCEIADYELESVRYRCEEAGRYISNLIDEFTEYSRSHNVMLDNETRLIVTDGTDLMRTSKTEILECTNRVNNYQTEKATSLGIVSNLKVD